MAEELEALPSLSPSGKPWTHLPRKELEELMLQQAERVKAAVGKVASGEVTGEEGRAGLEREIADAKPVFVRAALEYAVRRYPIRETAFVGGYAPLIFHARRWKLPPAE